MYITYMSSQKIRHQKLKSYWAMNSLGDNLSTQQRYPPQSDLKKITWFKFSHIFLARNQEGY